MHIPMTGTDARGDSYTHSEIYNTHLLYAQRLSEQYAGGMQPENPQEGALLQSKMGRGRADGAEIPESNDSSFVKKYLSRIVAAVLAVVLIGAVFVLLPYQAVHAAKNDKFNETLYWTAGSFVLIAVPVSVYGIVQHLVNYYMPQVQKFVVRILFMVPIFSVEAWFSLFFHAASEYIRAFRELYEAFVLSSFVYYIIELLGGEDQLALKLRVKDAKYGRHGPPFRFVCREWQMGRAFMTNCKYGVLQNVLVKVIATVLVIVLKAKGKWETGDWSWGSSWAYISVIMNLSIMYALYCLVKLYYATKDDLKDWNPVWKFMCIKGIIFFTFWQGFLIEVLNSAGVIKPVGDWTADDFAAGLSDFLITFEMVFFSIMHRYAFPHTDYLHYLQRQRSKGRRSRPGAGAGDDGDALLLFDHDNNVANDDSGDLVDAEYEPPTVRQLDRPLSVSRALMGSVVPSETVSDIARMSLGEGIVGSDSLGRDRATGSESGEVMMSMEEAERI